MNSIHIKCYLYIHTLNLHLVYYQNVFNLLSFKMYFMEKNNKTALHFFVLLSTKSKSSGATNMQRKHVLNPHDCVSRSISL